MALTRDTGTIKIEVSESQTQMRRIVAYGDGPNDDVFPRPETQLPTTDWKDLLEYRMHEPGH